MPVLVLDLNSFFASVEQQDDPALRGRAVGVVPVMSDSTCCIAASHAAKQFGVKTGTRVADAKKKKLCPGIVLREARPPRYVQIHQQIKAAVDRHAFVIEPPPSIDEFNCELPAGYQDWDGAVEIGHRVKRAILTEVGECLTCSVGIAPNFWLAKTASDMQKPDGLVVLKPKDLPQALFRLQLRDLCGIGANMEQRLLAAGIDTVEKLYGASALKLREAWGGIGGEQMWGYLRGVGDYQASQAQKSIGHSHVLPPELRTPAGAHAVIHRMLQKAAMRLRRQKLLTGSMQVDIRYVGDRSPSGWGRASWSEGGRFTATDDTFALSHALDALWGRQPVKAPKPLKVGVVLCDLLEAGRETLPLFAADVPKKQLLGAIDTINLKFGKNTLYFGAAHAAKDRSPMRIAFTRIPDVSVE
jgi:DNA polymerase-4